jgi:branched-chain amino acid transport system permease protein
MDFASFSLQFLNGLSYAMLLFLISSGLTIIFGVLGIINFSHGSLYMLGAYFSLLFTKETGNFWISLLVAPLMVAGIGAFIEVFCLRPVYRMAHVYQLLLTFGLVLFFEDLVKILWGTGFKTISMPQSLGHSVNIMNRSFPFYYLFIAAMGPGVALGLWLLVNKTRWGTMVRAATDNRIMASSLGINVPLLFTTVFAFGAYLGGVGGVLAGPLQAITPAIGVSLIIECFVVVVIGGLGSLGGAFLASLIIGQVESFGALFFPRFAMVLIFILMAVILIFLPRGLSGAREGK